MLPEVILSTTFLKSEIRKVHLEAKDIPYTQVSLECLYLYACFYSDRLKITKILEIVAG